jgi:Bifunctional DNA primase/polymerase, N-terminal
MSIRSERESNASPPTSAEMPVEGNESPVTGPHGGTTLARALAYARQGWPVFPCRPASKEPATTHGFYDASTDPVRITAWWERQPAANLAIATGRPGPDVLDVDQHGPAGNGFAALNRLKSAGLLDGVGAIVRTPHGGLHAYFAGSGQSSGRLPQQHLDFKAAGGYVLAPPSEIDARPYVSVRTQASTGGINWTAAIHLLEPVPSGHLQPQRVGGRSVGHLAAWVASLQEGNRNAGLFWAACRVVESGRPADLDALAAAAARSGLGEREIARTIDSARRGQRQEAKTLGQREATR